MADIRESRSKDLSFGNKTVVPFMQTWVTSETFIYGEPTQTLATALGLFDAEHQYEPFGYPIKVLMPYVANPGVVRDWVSLLSNWYLVSSTPIDSEISSEDLLVIIDVTDQSERHVIERAKNLVNVALSRSASVLIVTLPDKKLPRELSNFSGKFTGSVNSYWKVFTYHVIANAVASRNPRNVYLFGEGLRIVASAIGAVDLLARFDESPLALVASRVKVDSEISLNQYGKNLTPEEIFTSFGLTITDTTPPGTGIEYSDRQVLITPV